MSNTKAALMVILVAVLFPISARAQERPNTQQAQRVLAEVGLGVGTLVLSTGIGVAVGLPLAQNCEGWFCGLAPFATGTIGLSVGMLLLPAAITLAGSWVDGQGNIGGAYLGFLVGAAAGALLATPFVLGVSEDARSGVAAIGITGGALLAFAGAIIGYELWDANARQQNAVIPTASFDGETGMLGVFGTF